MSSHKDDKGGPDRGRTDMIKGKAKEVAGKVSGKDRLRHKGKAEQVSGKAKEKGNEAIDKAEEAFTDDD